MNVSHNSRNQWKVQKYSLLTLDSPTFDGFQRWQHPQETISCSLDNEAERHNMAQCMGSRCRSYHLPGVSSYCLRVQREELSSS